MSEKKLVIHDAIRQIGGRVISAAFGFFVISIISPYLGVLRYGDYSTILKFFAIWSALADFGLYIIAVKDMGEIKNQEKDKTKALKKLQTKFGKYVGTRLINITIVYSLAISLGYILPAYTANPYLIWGLPLGMIFSATFMVSGILQLPLQLFWRMKDLSIGLILARISQFIVLICTVYLLFPNIKFGTTPNTTTIIAFCLVLFSVVVSAMTQGGYVLQKGNKYLKLKVDFDRTFTKKIFKANRKYGISYYLSSFHILIVLIFLSNFFPSAEGNHHVGIWALGLALIEIFLIIPSALGNSLLHSIGDKNLKQKKISFGSLMNLSIWIGGLILANFILFGSNIVSLIGGNEYLGSTLQGIGSDTILPYLGIVLVLSFIKQVLNYIFISTNIHNKLLKINAIGVIIGVIVGIYTIPKRGLMGGIITQGILEILFVLGAIFIAWKNNKLPTIKTKYLSVSVLVLFLVTGFSYYFLDIPPTWEEPIKLILIGIIINGIMIGASIPLIKRTARTLNG